MITRIVMDVHVDQPSKSYVKGAVYDSRLPLDTPKAADGIQHCIAQHKLDFFIAQGWAHEQSWDEWAADKPLFKAHFYLTDSFTQKGAA